MHFALLACACLFASNRIDKLPIRPFEPDFHYHSRHIPLEHLNLDTSMGRVVASNGLHIVLEPDNLAKLKSFGVDTVELRLTWCELEKVPGQFDFSRFDRDIERVEKAGLQPGLMAWFNHPPSWYGGTRFKCLSHGLESTTLSPWDPATLREADRLYAKVAERYGDRIKFVYVTGSGDYGEPCLPQGVRHYVFSSPHSHIGLDWVGDRFARAAWARVSSVPPEDVVCGTCDVSHRAPPFPACALWGADRARPRHRARAEPISRREANVRGVAQLHGALDGDGLSGRLRPLQRPREPDFVRRPLLRLCVRRGGGRLHRTRQCRERGLRGCRKRLHDAAQRLRQHRARGGGESRFVTSAAWTSPCCGPTSTKRSFRYAMPRLRRLRARRSR